MGVSVWDLDCLRSNQAPPLPSGVCNLQKITSLRPSLVRRKTSLRCFEEQMR